jgi:hypothetical protein
MHSSLWALPFCSPSSTTGWYLHPSAVATCRRTHTHPHHLSQASVCGGCYKKAANSHILVPTTTSIKEVDEDNSVSVALYATERMHWMMDSGATHHITPHTQ